MQNEGDVICIQTPASMVRCANEDLVQITHVAKNGPKVAPKCLSIPVVCADDGDRGATLVLERAPRELLVWFSFLTSFVQHTLVIY